MKNLFKLKNLTIVLLGVFLCLSTFIGCSTIDIPSTTNGGQVVEDSSSNNVPSSNSNENGNKLNTDIADIPAYSGNDYVVLNDNVPNFSDSDLTTTSFEEYSPLDSLGRCGVAFANIGTDLMPTENRESISSVKPSGWQSVKYDIISGKYLYNRSHLIGFQLTAENANKENLITGTRYFNVEGMLPFENMVADYIKETKNHVLYRVTPVYDGNDLVAKGVQIEALSVEDDGEGIMFNIFAYNVQPGITIDYATGESWLGETNKLDKTSKKEKFEIRGNKNSKVYHCPGQANYERMADSDNLVIFSSEKEAIKAGYTKAKR